MSFNISTHTLSLDPSKIRLKVKQSRSRIVKIKKKIHPCSMQLRIEAGFFALL